MITLYKCETCGNSSTDQAEIISCEQKGVPKQLVHKGQKIYFKDCEETPIATQVIKNLNIDISCLRASDRIVDFWRSVYYRYSNSLMKLEVINVIAEGHQIKYILGECECPLWYLKSYSQYGDIILQYPVINNNGLMEKVLKLYN